MRYDTVAVYRLARSVLPDRERAVVATAVAWAESGLDPWAEGDLTRVGEPVNDRGDQHWGPSLGWWQIRSILELAGTGAPRDPDALRASVHHQAWAMGEISRAGTDWRPWTVWRTGAHSAHLHAVESALEARMTPLHVRAAWGARPARGGYATIASEGITVHHGGGSPWSDDMSRALRPADLAVTVEPLAHEPHDAGEHHVPTEWVSAWLLSELLPSRRVAYVEAMAAVDRSSPDAFERTTDHAYCAGILRSYQAWHMDRNGWVDLAYTSGVCPHGHRFEGRPSWARTAAQGTNDGNARSSAAVYIAGSGDPLTDSAKRAFHDEADRLWSLRWVHSDWTSTECPGDHIRAWGDAGWPHPDITGGDDDMTPEQDRLLRDIAAFNAEFKIALGGDDRWQQALADHVLRGPTSTATDGLRDGDVVRLERQQ